VVQRCYSTDLKYCTVLFAPLPAVRVYTASRVEAGEWEFVLRDVQGAPVPQGALEDWHLVWTEGVRAILRYAQEISAGG